MVGTDERIAVMDSISIENADRLNEVLGFAGKEASFNDGHVDVVFEREYMAIVITCGIARVWVKVPYVGSILTVYYPVSGYMNRCDIGHEDDMGEFFTMFESSDKEQLFQDISRWFKNHLL